MSIADCVYDAVRGEIEPRIYDPDDPLPDCRIACVWDSVEGPNPTPTALQFSGQLVWHGSMN